MAEDRKVRTMKTCMEDETLNVVQIVCLVEWLTNTFKMVWS